MLEAMQCGAVVVTSRDPAVTEVAGGAAIEVDATDTRALAGALAAVARSRKMFAGEFRGLAGARHRTRPRVQLAAHGPAHREVYETARGVLTGASPHFSQPQGDVAYAPTRAVSRLFSTPGWDADRLPRQGVGKSADAARTGACATLLSEGL